MTTAIALYKQLNPARMTSSASVRFSNDRQRLKRKCLAKKARGLNAVNEIDEINASIPHLGGGFKYFLFSPVFPEDSQFAKYISKGLKPPISPCLPFKSFFWWKFKGLIRVSQIRAVKLAVRGFVMFFLAKLLG